MKNLSELSDNMFLFSHRTDELVIASSVREYIKCGEENLGKYHTIKFLDGGAISLVDPVDIRN